jgi:SAM-dependent methyltransferase
MITRIKADTNVYGMVAVDGELIKPGNTFFPEMPLAHQYLDGKEGLEIGSAAHNSFGLAGSRNVAPVEQEWDRDFEFFKGSQIRMCGYYDQVDIEAEARNIPVDADSQDYVISSHVIEHLPDPILVFWEWTRIIKDNGIVFMIVPLRTALPADASRPVSKIEAICQANLDHITVESWDYEQHPVPGGQRGHYWVYTIDTMKTLIDRAGLPWTLEAEEAKDSKVGNGFTLVYRVHKEIQPREVKEDEMLAEAELATMNLGDKRELIGNPEMIAQIAESIADTAVKLNDVLSNPEQIVPEKSKRKYTRKPKS